MAEAERELIDPYAKRSRGIGFGILLVVTGLIGWLTSFALILEYIGQIRNIKPLISCDISPLVTCSPNLQSPAGNLLGFPNPLIGITLFVAPIVVGLAVLSGARFARWYLAVFTIFVLGAFVLVHWFAFMSILVIGSLCPWCMCVWLATIPMFWGTLGWSFSQGVFGNGRALVSFGRWLRSWAWVIVVLNYALIVIAAQVRLDVIGAFLR